MNVTTEQLERAEHAWEYVWNQADRFFACQHNCGWTKQYSGRLSRKSWAQLSSATRSVIATAGGAE